LASGGCGGGCGGAGSHWIYYNGHPGGDGAPYHNLGRAYAEAHPATRTAPGNGVAAYDGVTSYDPIIGPIPGPPTTGGAGGMGGTWGQSGTAGDDSAYPAPAVVSPRPAIIGIAPVSIVNNGQILGG